MPIESRFDCATGEQADVEIDAPPPPTLDNRRDTKRAAVIAAYSDRVTGGGYPVGGVHIQVDDGSRGNLAGMAVTALAALGGSVPWPDSYSRGWVSREGVRVPLPTPGDGMALAAGAGNYYAQLVQHETDLLEALDAAADAAALDAIDETAGWP